jgi:hypothetical protein
LSFGPIPRSNICQIRYSVNMMNAAMVANRIVAL